MQTDDQSDIGSEIFQNSYEFGTTDSSTTSESKLTSIDSIQAIPQTLQRLFLYSIDTEYYTLLLNYLHTASENKTCERVAGL